MPKFRKKPVVARQLKRRSLSGIGGFTIHPDWAEIYAGCGNSAERANDLVTVTRETLRLAADALRERNANDWYHNYGAAEREILDALRSDD